MSFEKSSPWKKLLERPDKRGHLFQIYQPADSALAENVGRYLWEGLQRQDGALVIATGENREALRLELDRLGANVKSLVDAGQMVFLDAQETLSRFMRAGQPHWGLFEHTIRSAMRQVWTQTEHSELRAYGEMVGILWKARQFSAAIRLEHFWNRLLTREPFSLFCGYGIDVFSTEFQISSLDGLLCTHTHLIPAANGNLEIAIHRAMEDILGPEARHLKPLMKATLRPSWAIMALGEGMALWLRNHLPGRAEQILECARNHHRALAARVAA